MKSLCDRVGTIKHSGTSSSNSAGEPRTPKCSESESTSKAGSLSTFLVSTFSLLGVRDEHASTCEKKAAGSRYHGWTAAVKRIMASGSMRRFTENMLGLNKSSIISSTSDIWLLGLCYKITFEDSTNSNPVCSSGFCAFADDFSSRILLTYRKGFDPIGDSKHTSDVGWGCMLRSSQMLVAQALLVHRLGRSWRKSTDKEFEQDYLQILHVFGDSEESMGSIHNLLQAGKAYGLAAGSWVGPYATCRAWENLVRCKKVGNQSLPLAIYVVSGDEDGERGGAPILFVEDVSRFCLEYSAGQVDWTPILLLVPLVLGLDKVNPRYVPLLAATFTFPQSLGIIGGKPGASTYIVGVQDEKAFYLDPHEVQQIVWITSDNKEADTSSYHCNVIRHFPLDTIDPSLAIGFYIRDKDDFNDFCSRASKLADESNGAPLFTVARDCNKSSGRNDIDSAEVCEDESYDILNSGNDGGTEEDWQLL